MRKGWEGDAEQAPFCIDAVRGVRVTEWDSVRRIIHRLLDADFISNLLILTTQLILQSFGDDLTWSTLLLLAPLC